MTSSRVSTLGGHGLWFTCHKNKKKTKATTNNKQQTTNNKQQKKIPTNQPNKHTNIQTYKPKPKHVILEGVQAQV